MSERDMRWALDLALLALSHAADYDDTTDFEQAAEMLRDGGPVVEKSKEFNFMCNNCGELYEHPDQYCTECISGSWSIERLTIPRTIRWTEREKIQIVPEKSEPTFKEVSDV